MEFGISIASLCLLDTINIIEVTQSVLAYIQKWVPNHKVGVLAGSSVHADRSFLVEEMPEVVNWLHYRQVFLLFTGGCSRSILISSIVGRSPSYF
jgi:hypothetical protein